MKSLTVNNLSNLLAPLPTHHLPDVLALLAGIISCVILFFGGLASMTLAWETEEYSHAYLIPAISVFLFYQKIPSLALQHPKARHVGIYFVLFGILLLLFGELSTLNVLIQYGFLFALTGFFISLIGWNGLAKCWPSLAYLCFMIPLPTIVQNNLSHDLQLLSSQIGVSIVRLFGISVYLEGNIIDLGKMQLQVVDACSGLRYLFPLMSFGFLIATIYNAPIWHKAVIFLSTVPITILMNSVRIGFVGITVEYFGISAAEGFLHYFEGWIIFLFCLAILFLVIQVLRHFHPSNRLSFIDSLIIDIPPFQHVFSSSLKIGRVGKTYFVSLALVLLLIPLVYIYGNRQDTIPERNTFNTMPLVHAGWIGREDSLEQDVINNLQVTDYFLANYTKQDSPPINLYVAYYDQQKKGVGIHSPKSCIPGGGWEIASLNKYQVKGVPLSSRTGDFIVNRAIIQKASHRSAVYYWFEQRGRIVSNEFLIRWYIFVDSIFKNRSDGALVRVSIPMANDADTHQTDLLADQFIQEFYPMLIHYIPN